MRKEILKILRCQKCLGKLTYEKGNLICNNCKATYPVHNGLVFMGYDKNKKDEIGKIIATERDHQTNLDEIQKHYDFAYPSFKIGLLSTRILKHDVKTSKPVAVDIGSGGAPMSKMLSELGFNTYRCELDPNSLYSGLFWKHCNLDVGKHIVCDAGILPFSNNSIDVVYCKEFTHHIEDYNSVLMEINRVLRKDGIFVMIEPTLQIEPLQCKESMEHFGHHYQTIFSYYVALKMCGLLPYRYYLYFYRKSKKVKLLNTLKRYFIKQIFLKSKTTTLGLLLKMHIQRLIGGTNVIFSKKIKNISISKKIPEIQIVDPSFLVLDENYLQDNKLQKFNEILLCVRKEISSTV